MSDYSMVGGIPQGRKKSEKMEQDRTREIIPREAKASVSYKPTITKKKYKGKTVDEALEKEVEKVIAMHVVRQPKASAKAFVNIVPNPEYIQPQPFYRGRMDEPLFDKPKEVEEVSRFMIQRSSSGEYNKLKQTILKDLDKITLQLKNTTFENTLLKLKRGSIVPHLEEIKNKIGENILVPIKLLLPHILTIGNIIDLIGDHDNTDFINETNYKSIKNIFSSVKTKLAVFVQAISKLNEDITNYDMNLVGLYEGYKDKMRNIRDRDKTIIRNLMHGQTLKRLESQEKMNIEEERFKQLKKQSAPTYKQKQYYSHVMNQYAASVRAYESYEFQLSELEDKLENEYREFVTKHLTSQFEEDKSPYNIYIAQDFMPKISFIYDVLKKVLTIDHNVKVALKTQRQETVQTADALADEFDSLFKNFFTSMGGKRKNLKKNK